MYNVHKGYITFKIEKELSFYNKYFRIQLWITYRWNTMKHVSFFVPHFMPTALLPGLYSLSGKSSFRQISWSLAATWLNIMMIVWCSGRDACLFSERLKKSKTKSHGFKASHDLAVRRPSVRLVNRGPGVAGKGILEISMAQCKSEVSPIGINGDTSVLHKFFFYLNGNSGMFIRIFKHTQCMRVI